MFRAKIYQGNKNASLILSVTNSMSDVESSVGCLLVPLPCFQPLITAPVQSLLVLPRPPSSSHSSSGGWCKHLSRRLTAELGRPGCETFHSDRRSKEGLLDDSCQQPPKMKGGWRRVVVIM